MSHVGPPHMRGRTLHVTSILISIDSTFRHMICFLSFYPPRSLLLSIDARIHPSRGWKDYPVVEVALGLHSLVAQYRRHLHDLALTASDFRRHDKRAAHERSKYHIGHHTTTSDLSHSFEFHSQFRQCYDRQLH